jgi:pyridinium-3,5-bisthiocarboxylic acid mononucleotide nickel chelatase
MGKIMRILYYDCFSGISGDMNLGAMIDIGVDRDYLVNELSKLQLHEYSIEVTEGNRKGITGTRVDVILEEHDHNHDHDNEGHHHEHGHDHEHEEHNQVDVPHTHHQRNLNDIREIIGRSSLNDNVKKLSLDIFKKVAAAEAKVHGKPIDEVHFHEVGAVDSIVDIVGAAICLDYLKVDKVIASPVETGSGFVRCAHGMLPVPAPATAEILKGIPLRSIGIPFEATTPTGAAILRSIADEFTDSKDFKILKIGYGIGHKDVGDIPNVLRVFIGEKNEKLEQGMDTLKEKAFMIECNIDDMNPENYDYIMEQLFREGVMDAYLTPIIMKKGRPAIKISVLCGADTLDKVERLLLSETSTLGVRKFEVEKTMLKRESLSLDTAYGKVRVKNAYLEGKRIKSKPEYDDCRKIAIEKGIPIMKVYEEINRELEHMKS